MPLFKTCSSRGILLFTILQRCSPPHRGLRRTATPSRPPGERVALSSWAQAADVWGDRGIEKPRSAANIRIHGGGVDDDRFLRRLSDFIGTAEHLVRTQSVTRGSRTLTKAVHD